MCRRSSWRRWADADSRSRRRRSDNTDTPVRSTWARVAGFLAHDRCAPLFVLLQEMYAKKLIHKEFYNGQWRSSFSSQCPRLPSSGEMQILSKANRVWCGSLAECYRCCSVLAFDSVVQTSPMTATRRIWIKAPKKSQDVVAPPSFSRIQLISAFES